MSCQRCKSERIAAVSAKCSDLCNFRVGGKERDYYVPRALGIGGGDYVEFDYCLDCGQIQDNFPISQEIVEGVFHGD